MLGEENVIYAFGKHFRIDIELSRWLSAVFLSTFFASRFRLANLCSIMRNFLAVER